MTTYSTTEWLRIATAGIVSPKERASVRQELLDHIDDHKEALVAAGFSAGEAEQQAVFAMGDPARTAKLLRRAHQPILTRLIQAARVCCITLAVLAVLSFLVTLLRGDDPLPNWFEGKPYPEDQAWFFQDPADDSILFRRVCQPEASVTIGDYVLRVDKAAVVQYTDRWEVHLLAEFDGKWIWQDPPLINKMLTLRVDGALYEVRGTDPRAHRQGGSHYGWFYAQIPQDADNAVLEVACEDQTYVLKIDLRGGDVYEKAH